jgi:hypothetical protein
VYYYVSSCISISHLVSLDNETLHLPDHSTISGLLSILSLINVAELGNVLHPDTYAGGVSPKERIFLIHVRSLGRKLRRALGCRLQLQGKGAQDHTSVITWANDYLLHQACALYNYKRLSDSATINRRSPGFTLQALEAQLSKCLGKNIWMEDNHPSFRWSQMDYEVVEEKLVEEPFDGIFRLSVP